MGLNVKRMRKKAASMGGSGDFLKFDEGDTLLYIHPPLAQADQHETTEGMNFLEFAVHYAVGPEGKMVISLDKESNPLLEHPAVAALLAKRKIKLKGQCPVGELLESGELTDDEANRAKLKNSFMWGVTVMSYRRTKAQPWGEMPFKPGILQAGKQITEGILDVICEEGDITDMKAAIFVRVSRSGKGLDTEYKVATDSASLRKPVKLDKEQRTLLKKVLAPGGDCDLFRVFTAMIKSPAQVNALISGMEMDESSSVSDDGSEEGEPESEEGEPESEEGEPESEEGEPESEEGEPESEEGEPESEEGEPESEEGEPEPEPEPEPKPKKKAKAKVDAKPKAKKKAKAKAKPKEDDGDENLDEIDAELERLSSKKK